jgi:uncharacterized heparinase superfamily protein
MISRIIRLFHTVRYLRPIQIYYRLWFRLYRPVFNLNASLETREPAVSWVPGAPKQQTQVGLQMFRFLNKCRELTSSDDWNNASWEKLWTYNLHYFDDLCAHDANERLNWHRKLVETWIKDNPPGVGIGWDSYPLSLRIVNWIKWAFAGNRLDRFSQDSLATQARYLGKRMEYHLLGNHLFANAKSLVFAGVFFSGAEANSWLKKGLKLIRQELPEQVLEDGGHFERSPMYHGIFLNDLLDLINLARCYPAIFDEKDIEAWTNTELRMRHWLVSMCHPDQNIAFFNDAALDIANSLAQLQEYASRLGLEPIKTPRRSVTNLQNSGFVRVDIGPIVGFLDVGEIGPRYNAAHAHAGTLSFELSLFNNRFLINSGTSCYERGPERIWQRGTSAHNTITIDGQDSSEVWDSFRVARRAKPMDFSLKESTEKVYVRCAHDGFMRFRKGALHTRVWIFQQSGIQIRDEIGGTFNEAIAYYHFHPNVITDLDQSGRRGSAKMSSGHVILWRIAGGVAKIHESTYHPRFGQTERSKCLAITFQKPTCEIDFCWN